MNTKKTKKGIYTVEHLSSHNPGRLDGLQDFVCSFIPQ